MPQKKIIFYYLFGMLFNSAIGGVTSLFDHQLTLLQNLIFAQCIGLTIMTVCLLIKNLLKVEPYRMIAMMGSLPFSVALGVTLGFHIIGVGKWTGIEARDCMLVGIFFGCIGALIFFLSERVENEVKQRKFVESESERREIEAHLKLLQAQIEPHFLFNTLANVSSLIDGNPELAKTLLERLIDWLRIALARARSDRTTLGDELTMLENLLEIMTFRFGDRLKWRIEVNEDIRNQAFPPMLLQPLVENALRHGIEPKIGGGEIVVRASQEDDRLRIEVADTGNGLIDATGSEGTGLANIRARLTALFGEAGNLRLAENDRGGVTATLTLPIAEAAV